MPSTASVIKQPGSTNFRHCVRSAALLHETSKEARTAAVQTRTAQIIFSFFTQHDFEALASNVVKELLGPLSGYYDYDENPAYLVAPQSIDSVYGKGYLLVFVADKAAGRIVDVKSLPEPK